MTDESLRQYVVAVGKLLGAIDNVEHLGSPPAIRELNEAYDEVRELQVSASIHASGTIDVPAPTVADGCHVPVLGDGTYVLPAVGAVKANYPTLDERFYLTWLALAEESKCDSWGGMECARVCAEWVAAGKPTQVTKFIIEHANQIPR